MVGILKGKRKVCKICKPNKVFYTNAAWILHMTQNHPEAAKEWK
jgi:hypothetical protein